MLSMYGMLKRMDGVRSESILSSHLNHTLNPKKCKESNMSNLKNMIELNRRADEHLAARESRLKQWLRELFRGKQDE